MVVAVSAGGKLCHRPKSGIRRLRIKKRGKAPRANGLITVHLRQVWLVYRTRADVLCVEASRSSQLMFQAKTPLQEDWPGRFSVGYPGDGARGKTICGFGLVRSERKLARCNPE